MDFWAWLQSLFAPKPPQPVAPSGTVLTLAPAYFGLPNNWLRGELFAGNAVTAVGYPNTPSAANAAAGVANLDAALHATPGRITVVGHSEGAQVINKWLREKGPTSDIDPARVDFVLTGDPERKGTGAMVASNRPWWVVAAYGGPGLPADTRYRVRNLRRVGDFFADYTHCTDQGAGMAAHNDYTQVSLNNATVDTVEGNVTYLSAP